MRFWFLAESGSLTRMERRTSRRNKKPQCPRTHQGPLKATARLTLVGLARDETQRARWQQSEILCATPTVGILGFAGSPHPAPANNCGFDQLGFTRTWTFNRHDPHFRSRRENKVGGRRTTSL